MVKKPKSRTNKRNSVIKFRWWMGFVLVAIIALVGIVIVRLSQAAEPGTVTAVYKGYDGRYDYYSQIVGGYTTNPRKYVNIRVDNRFGTADTYPPRCYKVSAGAKWGYVTMTEISGSLCGLPWLHQPALAWPMHVGNLSQCWGDNALQGRTISNPSWAGGGKHPGIDMGLPAGFGTPVLAAQNGTVSLVQNTAQSGGYGNFVVIQHPNEGLWTAYAHLNSINVAVGQNVAAYQQIGTMGNSGYSGGAHLHFMVQNVPWVTNGNNVPANNLNPLNFLGRSDAHNEGQCLRT